MVINNPIGPIDVLLAECGDVLDWPFSNNIHLEAAITYLKSTGLDVHQIVSPDIGMLRIYANPPSNCNLADPDEYIDINVLRLFKAMDIPIKKSEV